jgi:hypothetical protein
MKNNFHDLTTAEIQSFKPLFYIILGKGDNGWYPQVWQPGRTDKKSGELIHGYLADGDGSTEPMNNDPFEIYDYNSAINFIAQDVLQAGTPNGAEGRNIPYNYRLVPVYTGLERYMDPHVMIFAEGQTGSICPCREWPADDMDNDERTPLDHASGFKNGYEVDPNYNIPTYSLARASELIRQQMEAGTTAGYRYFTVPVTIQ